MELANAMKASANATVEANRKKSEKVEEKSKEKKETKAEKRQEKFKDQVREKAVDFAKDFTYFNQAMTDIGEGYAKSYEELQKQVKADFEGYVQKASRDTGVTYTNEELRDLHRLMHERGKIVQENMSRARQISAAGPASFVRVGDALGEYKYKFFEMLKGMEQSIIQNEVLQGTGD
jgi:hypothetical protein